MTDGRSGHIVALVFIITFSIKNDVFTSNRGRESKNSGRDFASPGDFRNIHIINDLNNVFPTSNLASILYTTTGKPVVFERGKTQGLVNRSIRIRHVG